MQLKKISTWLSFAIILLVLYFMISPRIFPDWRFRPSEKVFFLGFDIFLIIVAIYLINIWRRILQEVERREDEKIKSSYFDPKIQQAIKRERKIRNFLLTIIVIVYGFIFLFCLVTSR